MTHVSEDGRYFVDRLRMMKGSSNSKIVELSKFAATHRDKAAELVTLLAANFAQTSAVKKMAHIHVVSCILKNVQGPYVKLFAAILPALFAAVWAETETMDGAKMELAVVASCFHGILPVETMLEISASVSPPLRPMFFVSVCKPGITLDIAAEKSGIRKASDTVYRTGKPHSPDFLHVRSVPTSTSSLPRAPSAPLQGIYVHELDATYKLYFPKRAA